MRGDRRRGEGAGAAGARSAGLYHSTIIKYTIPRHWSWLSLKSSTMVDWNPRPTTRFESKKRPSCYKKRSKPSVRFVPVWLLNSANSVRTVSTPFATPRTTSAGSVASPATLLLTVTVPYQNGTLTLRHRSPRLNGLSAIVSHGNRG